MFDLNLNVNQGWFSGELKSLMQEIIKVNVKIQNRQFMTILSVRLMSIEKPRREDNKGVTNVHTKTPSRLILDTTSSEAEEGEMKDDYADL